MAYADNEHIHPFGVFFFVSTDNITFTEINDLAAIEGLEMDHEESVDTTLQSANRVKLATPGWMTVGDATVTAYHHQTQMTTLRGYFYARTNPLYWRVTYPILSTHTAGGRWDWQGWIKHFPPFTKFEKESNDKIMVSYVIKGTTRPVWTAGS